MDFEQKVATLTHEVIIELANLSRQKKPLTAEFLEKALLRRDGVRRALQTEDGQNGQAVEAAASAVSGGLNLARAGSIISEETMRALKRAGVALAVAAKRQGAKGLNNCIEDIKREIKKEEPDLGDLDDLLQALRRETDNLDHEDGPGAGAVKGTPVENRTPQPGLAPAFSGHPYSDVIDQVVEFQRRSLERILNQLQRPESAMFTTRVNKTARELGNNLSREALERLDQKVYDILVDYKTETTKERENLAGLLHEIAIQLVDAEKQFISTLIEDHTIREKESNSLRDGIDQQVLDIEECISRENDVQSLRELVTSKLNTIRQSIAELKEIKESRARELEDKIAKLRYRLSKNQKALTDIQTKAEKDPLTGILNRNGFNRCMKEVMNIFNRSKSPCSFIMFDIDDFKHINDRYGHLNGDKVLAAIGNCLNSNLRKEDISFRYGGEEFSVILPNTDLSGSKHVAEQLRSIIKKLEFISKGERVMVTISLGVTEFKEGDRIKAVIDRADQALYTAKAEGKDQVKVLV